VADHGGPVSADVERSTQRSSPAVDGCNDGSIRRDRLAALGHLAAHLVFASLRVRLLAVDVVLGVQLVHGHFPFADQVDQVDQVDQ
jgi:hypothetical protein